MRVHSPTFCCFFRLWQPVVASTSSFTCISPQRTPSTFRFIRQKKDLRAPGQSRETPWGTSVFTGNIAETITQRSIYNYFVPPSVFFYHLFIAYLFFIISHISRCPHLFLFLFIAEDLYRDPDVAISSVAYAIETQRSQGNVMSEDHSDIRLIWRFLVFFFLFGVSNTRNVTPLSM